PRRRRRALSEAARRRGGVSVAAPDRVGDLDDEAQLRPLRLDRDRVAVHRAREAALRRDAELLDRRVRRRLVDPALEHVPRLELAELGRDEAEDDGLALGEEPQRPDVARALVVVFEEVAVDVHLGKQRLGDRLVAALRRPCALEVAAAQVHAQRHAGGFLRDDAVDERRVAVRQLVRVVAARARRLAHLVVAQVGEVGVVHLHVAAAGGGERAQLGTVGVGDVLPERLEVGVVLAADAGAAAAEVQHRRRRDRHLRRVAGADLRPQVLEVGALDVLDVADLVDHAHHRRRELLAAVGLLDGRRNVGLDAGELLEKVDVEVGAAELAVGDAAQPHVLLEADDLGDRVVLDGAQLRGRDLALGAALARVEQAPGPEEAADVIGAKRRLRAGRHRGSLGRVGTTAMIGSRSLALANVRIAAAGAAARIARSTRRTPAMQRRLALGFSLSLLAAAALPSAVHAQGAPFKIGLILPMTGQQASTGKQEEAAVKLWLAQNGATVAGRKVEVILKDDGGVPDATKRIAQELVVNDKVDVLLGFGITPSAFATAPIATQSKTPMVVSAEATSAITERSPYIVRTSFTLPQVTVPMADWAAKHGIKKVVTFVSDYGPGLDAEKFFKSQFTLDGGQIVGEIRTPLRGPDFAPFLQKVADLKPDAVFVFLPSGQGAAFMKQFGERGMDK